MTKGKLTTAEVATLNRARTLLTRYSRAMTDAGLDRLGDERQVSPFATSYGRQAALAEVAADAIFHVLSTANSYRLQSLTAEQIHGHR